MSQFDNGYHDFAAEHGRHLNGMFIDHIGAMDRIVASHVENVEGAGLSDLEAVLGQTATRVGNRTDMTRGDVARRLGKDFTEFHDLASAEDLEAFASIRERASQFGVGQATSMLRTASSREARSAMHSALDQILLNEAWERATHFGSGQATPLLRGASSREARSAIHAAIDHILNNSAHERASQFGVGQATPLLRAASGRGPRLAMHSGLDSVLFSEVHKRASQFGVGQATPLLRAASGLVVRNAMNDAIRGMNRENRDSRRGYSGFDDDRFGGSYWGAYAPGEEPRGRRGGQRQHGGHSRQQRSDSGEGRRRQQPPPRAESNGRARTSDLESIVAGVTDSSSQKTLRVALRNPEGRKTVQRVVSSVRAIRKKAEDRGETVTDREIYIKYRRKIATADVDPELEESAKILLNLMGGKPKGSLPF